MSKNASNEVSRLATGFAASIILFLANNKIKVSAVEMFLWRKSLATPNGVYRQKSKYWTIIIMNDQRTI